VLNSGLMSCTMLDAKASASSAIVLECVTHGAYSDYVKFNVGRN
jgi:hypothetical protein